MCGTSGCILICSKNAEDSHKLPGGSPGQRGNVVCKEEEIMIKDSAYAPKRERLYVQSYISNIAFPKTLTELLDVYILDRGELDLERVLTGFPRAWIAPKWAKQEDIVFFMHAKSAKNTISELTTTLDYGSFSYTEDQIDLLQNWLSKGRKLYSRYGGKIFAVGHIGKNPEYSRTYVREEVHWRSGIYAGIEDCWILDNPVPIEEFRDYIFVSKQSSITPVFGDAFRQLKALILQRNSKAPEYFLRSVATPIPLAKINESNWLTIINEYRRSFILELQFRSYYVDRFLQLLGDQKKIYSECRCRKIGMIDSYVNNLILFNGRYLPVEVKLNIDNEKDLLSQIKKYCNDDVRFLDSDVVRAVSNSASYMNEVLLIDTEQVLLYNDACGSFLKIAELDEIKTERDIFKLREKLIVALN